MKTSPRRVTRLLLLGAGYTGRIVADALSRDAVGQQLVVVLDDDPSTHGMRLGTATVEGPLSRLAERAAAHAVDEVVIAIPSLPGPRLRELTAACNALALPVRTMPGIVELLGRPISPKQLRPVELADLLRRSAVRCDAPPPAYLQDQRVLITGAGGSIGRELARQVLRAIPERLVLLGHGENSIHAAHVELTSQAGGPPVVPLIADVTDRSALDRAFEAHTPTVVFHAAAHKHVPLMELHPAEAVRNNVLGTWELVACAERHAVPRLLFVSTDKAVAPASVMGATKRIGEWIVSDAAARLGLPYLSVRFGNVLGSRGSVVPALEQQLADGGPLTLTHPEATRFFMTIPEAVYLVLQAGAAAAGDRLYVLDMGDPVRITDLAADLVRLSGLRVDDVPVRFTGLRPGEKLQEALWEPGSSVTPVDGADILEVRETPAGPRGPHLTSFLEDLVAEAREGDPGRLHQRLASAIPTFVSSLSL